MESSLNKQQFDNKTTLLVKNRKFQVIKNCTQMGMSYLKLKEL